MKTSRTACVALLVAGVVALHHEVLLGGQVYHKEDAADGYYPSHVAILRAWSHGELPTWERGSWSGWPLGVDPYYGLVLPAELAVSRSSARCAGSASPSRCTRSSPGSGCCG